MAKAKSDRKTIDIVFVLLGLAATVVLLAVGTLAWVASDFAKTTVKDELSSQKIYFPEKDSPALKSLPESDRVAMEQYAGEQLTTGDQAKVYADNYIGVHLGKIAGGKTYSEVSAEAMANPTDTKLAAQKQTLFQGETLRGLLLGDGYAYWTIGQIAYYAAAAALAGAGVMVILVLFGMRHISRK
ncbi:MAG: hypothetical protein H6797_02155 [Candidatus Nomurabacteria bacterium]|nr:MAG: hypothetical protein H6797_02155 [Candidatus Nomurabacteria bacterium]